MSTLKDTRIVISGASRGIGLAIALRAAADGARVAVLAKTAEPHPKLKGTIFTAADEIKAAGGDALPLVCDVRSEESVEEAVSKTVDAFGGIDIVINNASAIFPLPTLQTPIKRWDLMHQVNARGTFLLTQKCLPHLFESTNPHILTLSPPLDLDPRWFGPHVAYTIAKYGMSLCVLGWAEEFRDKGVAANALWPRTGIATAAIENVLAGEKGLKLCRTPQILSDAAHLMLTQPAREFTGNFIIDDTFLYERGGVSDFDQYRVDPAMPLMPDFFVPADSPPPPGVVVDDPHTFAEKAMALLAEG